MIRRALLALALLAAPLAAQTTVSFDSTETVYASGPKIVRAGLSKGKGTSGDGVATDWVAGTVGMWDLGNTRELIKGGYDLVPLDNDFYRRTASVPFTTSGFWGVCWFNTDVATLGQVLFTLTDGTDLQAYTVGITVTTGTVYAEAVATTPEVATTTGAIAAARWQCVIFFFASSTSRGVYLDTDTTGATNTNSKAPATSTNVTLGRDHAGLLKFDGLLGSTWLFSGTVPGTAARAAIFAGGDPEIVAAQQATALWKLDNDDGADSRGSFALTASGTPVAANSIAVVRDLSGGGRHMKGAAATPTWSASVGNGQGGGVFLAASTQRLLINSTPVTGAPFQVYAVAQVNDVTAAHCVFNLGDKDVNDNDQWMLAFRGDSSDQNWWVARDDAGNGIGTTTGTFVADTNYLLWGLEASATSRTCERNGGATGTDTTSKTPDLADTLSIGAKSDSTPDQFLDGEIHFVLLLDTASTANQARIEKILSNPYGFGF